MTTENEKGRAEVVQIGEAKGGEEGIEIGDSIGRQEGREEGIRKTAINMLKEKVDVRLISKVTGYTLEEVLKMKNKL